METNARYTLIGGFTLAVIAACFGFVLWLHTTGGVGAETVYRLRFAGSVAGLRPGSTVQFNGIRVGEVKDVRIGAEGAQRVEALIGVARGTPITADTGVMVESQGLVGSPVVLLVGGSGPTLPSPGPDGRIATLEVGASGSETLSSSALGVLRRMDKILAENADPFNNILVKLSTFSDALARNSGRIDSIVEGLDRTLGGGKDAKPAIVYDLAAPKSFPALKNVPTGRLAVLDPSALVVFDTQKVLVSPGPGQRSVMSDAQWSDSLPKLLQTKTIESFENAGYLGHVGRGSDPAPADQQLQLDIRNFQVEPGASPKAVIELVAKVQGADGQTVAAKVFKAEAPISAIEPMAAAQGLSTAFATLAADLVPWANEASAQP
jgi:phospholipid/cholesterol/gamma-HCH transport system substrate-binding protein